ncbi:MAG: aminopeptidase P family protein [Thermoplasmata archaeon]|nr:MAG: aminopeptidase P family protein [Thermoplasmata archaeon]
MEHRIKKIFQHSSEQISEVQSLPDGLDAIVFMNGVEPILDMSFFYVTGMVDGMFELASAVVFPDGGSHVIAHSLEETTAKKGKFDLSVFRDPADIKSLLKTQLSGAKAVGVNADELTFSNFNTIKSCCGDGTKFIDIGPAVKAARVVKDEVELERLEKAGKIVSEVARDITSNLEEGIRENEVGAELSYKMQKLGANRPSFALVSFGELTAEPHYMGGARKLGNDQFIILDFGAVYYRYHSDITRTYYKGKPDEKALKLYEHSKRAQEVALENIRAGANAKDVHQKVLDYVESTEYKGLFPHATGHTLGLSVHDGERLFTWDLELKENMVFTVEPGIYIPGYGGVRVEDDIVVTKDGYRMLTDAPRELLEV